MYVIFKFPGLRRGKCYFPTVDVTGEPRSIYRLSLTFSYQLNDSTSFMHASALRLVRRGLATAAAHPPHASPSSSHVTAATSAIPLSNVEAQWATLSPPEQTAVHQQLEELQRKDWNNLSLAEKKAGASICPDLISSPPSLLGGGRGRQSVELVVHASCTVQPTMLRLARMDLVRRSTHLARSSRSSLVSPSSLAPPVCFTLASALWVC